MGAKHRVATHEQLQRRLRGGFAHAVGEGYGHRLVVRRASRLKLLVEEELVLQAGHGQLRVEWHAERHAER